MKRSQDCVETIARVKDRLVDAVPAPLFKARFEALLEERQPVHE
jgi:hypothetical protein